MSFHNNENSEYISKMLKVDIARLEQTGDYGNASEVVSDILNENSNWPVVEAKKFTIVKNKFTSNKCYFKYYCHN